MSLGYLSLIIATAFWGGNFVLGKVLSGVVPPISLIYLRWLPAFVILVILFHKPARQTLSSLSGKSWLVM